ncbi:MAG TPA: protein kinase [Vicinamibacterales bacterium]|nr:protein kinase [Vicinamibacterales bacterium]
MVGTTLGHYRIVGLLGKGGMGEVYAAEDLKLGRRVAVNVLPPALVSGPGDLERLDREARAVAALNHPGIVTLYSFEEAGGVRFLTMELIEGHSLSDELPAAGFPTDKLLDIGERIADGVSAAHEKGIVHRDLKPDGERIAFRSTRDGGGLFVMGRTGEAPRRLTSDGTASSWSPDGKEIVYALPAASRRGTSTAAHSTPRV